MKQIDPDSFRGRIVLNGVDKLVFTLLLFIIFAMWTDRQREFERESVREEKIQGMEIERPITLIEDLSGPIRRCILFLRLNRIGGVDGDKLENELQPLLVEIQLHADMIANYTEKRKKETSEAARKLSLTVYDFGFDVMTDSVSVEQYHAFEELLVDQFDSLFSSAIEETVAMDDRDHELFRSTMNEWLQRGLAHVGKK